MNFKRLLPICALLLIATFQSSCEDEENPEGDCGTCAIADLVGSGTAYQVSPNTCGDRPITVTNDGVDRITLDMPVASIGQTLLLQGTLSTDCTIALDPDTIDQDGIEMSVTGSGKVCDGTLTFTYRATMNGTNSFDCDYRFDL